MWRCIDMGQKFTSVAPPEGIAWREILHENKREDWFKVRSPPCATNATHFRTPHSPQVKFVLFYKRRMQRERIEGRVVLEEEAEVETEPTKLNRVQMVWLQLQKTWELVSQPASCGVEPHPRSGKS